MEFSVPQKWSGTTAKIVVLSFLTLFTVVLTVFCLQNNIQIVFTHFYYVPIIIAAYWFNRNGVLYALALATFYLVAVFLGSPQDPAILVAAIWRAVVFIAISLVIALLAQIIHGQQEKIVQSEAQFRGVWDSIQAAIIIVDPKTHTIIAANPEAQRMTGYPIEEMKGHVCHRFICPAEQGNCPISDKGMNVEHAERVLIARDGKKVPVLKTVTEVDIGGRPVFIENFIDITAIKDTENALNAYIREAALRIRNPVELVRDNLREIREELTGRDSPPGYIATALAIQEKNIDGIINNLQELDRAIAEKRTEIPEAMREYMKR